MQSDFEVTGENEAALFTLKLHRGEGMTLLAMNWKDGTPTLDFVGFAIEYKEPGGNRFFVLNNRLTFADAEGNVNPNRLSTRLSPIQKFRWVHFPRNAELPGQFVYRVTPVFMNTAGELSYGEAQEAPIVLQRETFPGELNVAFTRGFVSSQAFVDHFVTKKDGIETLLPPTSDEGLGFVPSHPNAAQALAWMGFEARSAVLEVLDQAILDITAQVRVIAYDLNQEEVVSRLERIGARLKVIIDDEGKHGEQDSAETAAAARLVTSTGSQANVKRQHMGNLQHNKTIVVDGSQVQAAVCGSTNFSWRGFYVQNNNAIILHGPGVVKIFSAAFNDYWNNDQAGDFGKTGSAKWIDLGLAGIDAQIGFSPRSNKNAVLAKIAKDMRTQTTSSLFFSLAFLHLTPGPIKNAIRDIAKDDKIFAYGISDHAVKGLELLKPDGKVSLVSPEALTENLPEPFKAEPVAGGGARMHHKFVVIDFDKPTARVYVGSFNFSGAADTTNGENLLLIQDRRLAVAYTVEALRIFDHYHFRIAQQDAAKAKKKLVLARPPRSQEEKPWWDEDYTNERKIRDRELFA